MERQLRAAFFIVNESNDAMQFPIALRLITLLVSLFLLSGCAVNPVTGRQNFTLMSEAKEVSTGRQADAGIRKEYGVYNSPTLQSYVNEIGQKLAKKSHRPNLNYQFTVVDSPDVNAFALPGGYVYITRGIISYLNSEAELAAVLGHEIGHVTARHGVQQYTAATAANVGTVVLGVLLSQYIGPAGTQLGQSALGVMGNVILSGYGREHELEADRLGAEYLARSGYDPQAMIKVIGILKNQELFDIEVANQEGREPRRYHGIFASHPDNDTRLHEVIDEAKQFALVNAADNRAEFLHQTEGMAYGESSAYGIIRENTFQHGELGFGVTFPPSWHIRNQSDKVQATSPQGEALMELTLVDNPRGSPADFARQHFQVGASNEVLAINIKGLSAAILTSTTRNGRPFMAGVFYYNGKAFILTGVGASLAIFDQHHAEINDAIRSFHALTAAERKSIKPLSIRTITAGKGLSYAELASQSPLGANAANYLRLINGQYPDGEPVTGQTIKIIK